MFRSCLYLLGVFSGPECGALCIHRGSKLVHYSGFTARYWRFAFMDAGDLQIGDTWTDPHARGLGLAQFALRQVIALMRRPGRTFWYCVEAINVPSIRVARSGGFEAVAEGEWKKPFGLKFFGSYVPTRRLGSKESVPLIAARSAFH